MEIPDLVRERLGDEEIRAGVSLGDEDAVCLTPSRTLVYRGEGILSDESVSVLPLDVERVDVSDGRRKSKFHLAYVDGEESFSVPASRAQKVLELLLEGVLRVAGVADGDESVLGVYRFSELTLVLTEGRLVKLVGSAVWDEDSEEFPFDDVTGLEFEEGSVATQIVLTIDGRPQRIKAPNDEAPKLRQTLADALCEYHGADSLATLNDMLGPDEDADDGDAADADDSSGSLTLDAGIDPLVGGDADETEGGGPMGPAGSSGSAESTDAAESGGATETGEPGGTAGSTGAGGSSPPGESPATASGESSGTGPGGSTDAGAGATGGTADSDSGPLADAPDTAAVEQAASQADVEEIAGQVETLTTAVKRQNELLRKQQQTIKQLIEELRQGR